MKCLALADEALLPRTARDSGRFGLRFLFGVGLSAVDFGADFVGRMDLAALDHGDDFRIEAAFFGRLVFGAVFDIGAVCGEDAVADALFDGEA